MESLDWAQAVVTSLEAGDYPKSMEVGELPRGNFDILDMVAKRNVVFVSWQQGAATGTWVMGFDRDGTLSQFTPVQ